MNPYQRAFFRLCAVWSWVECKGFLKNIGKPLDLIYRITDTSLIAATNRDTPKAQRQGWQELQAMGAK